MNNEKIANCVAIKRGIQEDIFRDTEGMTDDQILEYFRNAVETWDHPLAREWHSQQMQTSAHEDPEKYGA